MNNLFMLRFLALSLIPMGEGWGEGNHRANNFIVGIGLTHGAVKNRLKDLPRLILNRFEMRLGF